MITEDITFVYYLNTHARAKADPVCSQDVQKPCNGNLRSKDLDTRWKWVVKFLSF